jgi:2-polyprenyl-6-methoxyphenol hydroxylase-like FAD-dependent oxidoreductase
VGNALRSPTSARVLVVGAGIAGLATARALARAGIEADVVERERAWQEPGAGIYLPGNAARALRLLALEQAVSEKAVVIASQRVCDHRGRLLVQVDVAGLWNGVGPCLALQRTDLHAVLVEGAAEVPIGMGIEVRGLQQRDGALTVEFGAGDAADYDLVIGADGIHSSVRALAFGGEAAVRPVGQIGWRFVADCPPEVTTWSVMLGHRSAFLMLPIGDGRIYCYCDVIPSSGEPDDDLDRLFSGFAEPVPALLDGLPRWGPAHRSTIEEVALDSWVRGRVVLVGDAAHATSPNMAEGAAMALEDGVVLADTLRQFGVSAEALSAFEARRRPRTDWVRAQTHRRDRTRYLPAVVRNTTLRAFGRRIFRSNYRPLLDEA